VEIQRARGAPESIDLPERIEAPGQIEAPARIEVPAPLRSLPAESTRIQVERSVTTVPDAREDRPRPPTTTPEETPPQRSPDDSLATPSPRPPGDAAGSVESEGAVTLPSPWPDAPLPTALGGLLFLLPVLERIGIAALLDRDPGLLDADVPARALLLVGERLSPDTDDAMLLLLRRKIGESAPAPIELLRGLVTEARRWCRRNARIGVRDLVLRRAHLVATETHVDVIFDLRDADIRVRRAALDVDPGWVPWFGRVVYFHYFREGPDED
jgi:hypothetical protein